MAYKSIIGRDEEIKKNNRAMVMIHLFFMNIFGCLG